MLDRFDAVVVLSRTDIPEKQFVYPPGTNRSYGPVVENLTHNPLFVPVPTPVVERDFLICRCMSSKASCEGPKSWQVQSCVIPICRRSPHVGNDFATI